MCTDECLIIVPSITQKNLHTFQVPKHVFSTNLLKMMTLESYSIFEISDTHNYTERVKMNK